MDQNKEHSSLTRFSVRDVAQAIASTLFVAAVLWALGSSFNNWVLLHDLGINNKLIDKRVETMEASFRSFSLGKSRFTKEGDRIEKALASIRAEHAGLTRRLRDLELKTQSLAVMQSMSGNQIKR